MPLTPPDQRQSLLFLFSWEASPQGDYVTTPLGYEAQQIRDKPSSVNASEMPLHFGIDSFVMIQPRLDGYAQQHRRLAPIAFPANRCGRDRRLGVAAP